ncbi:TetR/AcrR family transcriptional regulator [Amycolatopsis magusensis]|uniref:TetR/AcrR family transcriptional regulator n=1 Tax=Amycolatopsis magusensis TaxID=882444 RepID=UPI003C2B765E
MSLREQKKEQTRRLIAVTAWDLFADRGFDAVRVAEVAKAAQVAEATVFNYFPTKEDLFYAGIDAFGGRLLDAVRTRPAGEPVITAFRRCLMHAGGLLVEARAGDWQALDRLRTVSRLVDASPALRAREYRATAELADALTDVLGGDFAARVVANSLISVYRSLVCQVRQGVLDGHSPGRVIAETRRYAEEAFDLLERGLGEY